MGTGNDPRTKYLRDHHIEKAEDQIGGLYQFIGFHPSECAERDSCHINKIGYQLDRSKDGPDEKAYGFNIFWNHNGDLCKPEQFKYRSAGYSWAENGQILMGANK